MARYSSTTSRRPAYQAEWEGRRVEWTVNATLLSGLVLEAGKHRDSEGEYISLRVARDDGFLEIGLDTRWVTRL